MYARIQNGIAVDVRSESPVGCFTDDFVAQFVAVPDNVQNGWLFDGTNFAPPPGPTQEQLDAEAARVAAEQVKQVSQTRSNLWTLIKSYRDNLIQKGGYLANNKWFHSDTFSRTQQIALVMMGASVPAVQWKTMDGSFITMTQTLAGQIFGAAAVQDQALFSHAEFLHATVLAAEDPTSVDITAGWPATYGGG